MSTKLVGSGLVLTLALNLMGCVLFKDNVEPPPTFGPREQIFLANFEEVWRALNIAISHYPLRVSNPDQGIVETEVIRGVRIWRPPHKSNHSGAGQSYRLVINILKGNLKTQTATKVSISKEARIQPDFFTDEQPLPSDGLEEKSILYRIQREIIIERALEKAQKKRMTSGS